MAKVITFFTSIILIYIIYNYPINKGYPLLGFLICLIVLSFSASKIYSDYKKMGDETFENVEKNTDKILKNNAKINILFIFPSYISQTSAGTFFS